MVFTGREFNFKHVFQNSDPVQTQRSWFYTSWIKNFCIQQSGLHSTYWIHLLNSNVIAQIENIWEVNWLMNCLTQFRWQYFILQSYSETDAVGTGCTFLKGMYIACTVILWWFHIFAINYKFMSLYMYTGIPKHMKQQYQ